MSKFKVLCLFMLMLGSLFIFGCDDDENPPPDDTFKVVFSETFENGLQSSVWNWDHHNWRGEKTIVQDNPYNGGNALFMKGSDHSPGGCSLMQSKTRWGAKESKIQLAFRDAKGIDGPGHDGYGGGDGGAKITLLGPNGEYICSFQDNYDSESHGRTTTGTTIPQDRFFLQANQWNYDTGIQLDGMEGWHTLTIHYQSAEATGESSGMVKFYLDESEAPLLTQEIDNAPVLDAIAVGAIGQYTYTGEWCIDDIQVSATGLSSEDSDNDGVADPYDTCENTPAGEPVDETGCSLSQKDSDNDGVSDEEDLCPDTLPGTAVDNNGCAPLETLTDSWSVTVEKTSDTGCNDDDDEEPQQVWSITQSGSDVSLTADPDDPLYTGQLNGYEILFDENIDSHPGTTITTTLRLTFQDSDHFTGSMTELIEWDSGACTKTYALSGIRSPLQTETVFREDFEAGLRADIWDWDRPGYRGEKTIIEENPHGGSKCLFMKGANHSPGGCSMMQSKTAWNLNDSWIQLSFRDAVGVDGPGHDGYGGGDGGAKIILWGPNNEYICSFQDNYDSESHGRTTTGTTIPQDRFFLQANQWNYDTGIQLAGMNGWHTLKIHYQSSAITSSGSGMIHLYLDDSDTPLLSQSIDSAPVLDSITVGALGQYTYTGEWFIDDITVATCKAPFNILYTANDLDGTTYALYTMNGDGTGRTPIPGGEGGYSATWSEDKSQIVYGSQNSTTGKGEIFIINSDGTNRRQLTEYGDFYGQSNPIFSSPTEIMWSHSMGTGHSEIAIMNTDGTNKRDLTNFYAQGKQTNFIRLDRVHSKIYYYKQDSSWSPTGEIYKADSDLTNEVRLTSNSNSDNYPSISPDGSKIVYVRYEASNGYSPPANLHVMDADGNNSVKITAATGNQRYSTPQWSPDGSYIFCSFFDGTQTDIVKMKGDGTEESNLTQSPNRNEHISDLK